MKRREEGRCFQCGLAFGPGHRCLEKSLRVVILAEDEQLTDEGEITTLENGPCNEGEEELMSEALCQWMELS